MAEDDTATPAPGPKLNLQHFQLLNGLQVVAANLPQAPSVAVQLLIKHGTSSLQGPPGMVALLASLWAYPVSNSPASQFREGEIPFAIRTDPDSIVLQAECGSDALDFSLRLFAQLMMQTEVSDEVLERVRQQLLSRLESAGPLELGRDKFAAALFAQHPYGQSGWGDPELIKKITREQVMTFIKEQIKPNQSAIILTGAISNLEMGDLIRSRLGAWVKGGREPQSLPLFTSRGSSVSLSLKVKEIADSLLLFGMGMPPRLSNQYYELIFLNYLLGGCGSGSRLIKEFTRLQIPFSQLESRLDFYRVGGQLQIVARLPGNGLERPLEIVRTVLESFKNFPVAPETLEMARKQLLREYEGLLHDPVQLARWLVQMELYEMAPSFLPDYSAALKAVTPERIQQVAKQCLSSAPTVTVMIRGAAR